MAVDDINNVGEGYHSSSVGVAMSVSCSDDTSSSSWASTSDLEEVLRISTCLDASDSGYAAVLMKLLILCVNDCISSGSRCANSLGVSFL